MKLTLIRHTSVSVATGICYGQSDVDVSASFEQEASLVFSKLPLVPFDAVYSSPLLRCRKLASFCGFNDPILDNRLMELNFGDWEMKQWTTIHDRQLQRWFDNWQEEIPTGGESFKAMTARVEEFLDEIANLSFQRVAIFTHAGVIRSAGIITGRFNANEAFSYQVGYGDTMEISLQ